MPDRNSKRQALHSPLQFVHSGRLAVTCRMRRDAGKEIRNMDIEKVFQVAAPREKVWDFVTNAEQVATCIPGVEQVQVTEPGKYKGLMTIKVGPIKASVKADVQELERRPPEFASYGIQGEEGGRASRLNAEAKLLLKPLQANLTEVTFNANVVIVGRLGKFAGGVMNKLADGMSEEFVTAFRSRLEPPAEAAPPAMAPATPAPGLWSRLIAFLRRLFGLRPSQ